MIVACESSTYTCSIYQHALMKMRKKDDIYYYDPRFDFVKPSGTLSALGGLIFPDFLYLT